MIVPKANKKYFSNSFSDSCIAAYVYGELAHTKASLPPSAYIKPLRPASTSKSLSQHRDITPPHSSPFPS